MSDQTWTNDFFAAIVTVASVTIFTKFMVHRSRKNKGEAATWAHVVRGITHTLCVVASLVAMGFGLYGLAQSQESRQLEIAAALTLGGALLILIGDGVLDDFRRRHVPGSEGSVDSPAAAEGSTPHGGR